MIETVSDLQDWATENLEESLRQLQEKHDYKKSQFFMMVRQAITGREFTPPLFETMAALGKEVTLERLRHAQDLLIEQKTV